MDNGSFAYLDDRTPRTRPVIVGGIAVLLLALAGVIAAGVVASSRADDAPPAASTAATVTVQAAPDGAPAGAPDDGFPEPGTYQGRMSSVADDDTAGASWDAVATLGGDTGMIVYPTTSCTALLGYSPAEDLWTSTALTSQCSGEGAWRIDARPGKIIELAFVSASGAELVTGTLSYVDDQADRNSAR